MTLCDDYQTAKLAFSSAQRAAEDITAAVAERIQADRAQTAERVAELERLVRDGSRPASARRVWEMELAQLQGRTFSATQDEVAAFEAEITMAEEAVQDFHRLQREIREAIQTINEAITELRKQTLGDPATGLWGNRLEGVQKQFKPLCQEVSI